MEKTEKRKSGRPHGIKLNADHLETAIKAKYKTLTRFGQIAKGYKSKRTALQWVRRLLSGTGVTDEELELIADLLGVSRYYLTDDFQYADDLQYADGTYCHIEFQQKADNFKTSLKPLLDEAKVKYVSSGVMMEDKTPAVVFEDMKGNQFAIRKDDIRKVEYVCRKTCLAMMSTFRVKQDPKIIDDDDVDDTTVIL